VISSYCPQCGPSNHPITNVLHTTERRHGTYIHAALALRRGHSLTIGSGMCDLPLFCSDCERSVIEADGNGRWRGEYQTPQCRLPWYQPAKAG
jgi:hypothetical protein